MEDDVLKYYSQIRPVVNEIRAKYPGLQINFEGGYLLAQASSLFYQTLQEIRKEIEGMKKDMKYLRATDSYTKTAYGWHNVAIDQSLQVIDKHLNEGDATGTSDR